MIDGTMGADARVIDPPTGQAKEKEDCTKHHSLLKLLLWCVVLKPASICLPCGRKGFCWVGWGNWQAILDWLLVGLLGKSYVAPHTTPRLHHKKMYVWCAFSNFFRKRTTFYSPSGRCAPAFLFADPSLPFWDMWHRRWIFFWKLFCFTQFFLSSSSFLTPPCSPRCLIDHPVYSLVPFPSSQSSLQSWLCAVNRGINQLQLICNGE